MFHCDPVRLLLSAVSEDGRQTVPFAQQYVHARDGSTLFLYRTELKGMNDKRFKTKQQLRVNGRGTMPEKKRNIRVRSFIQVHMLFAICQLVCRGS